MEPQRGHRYKGTAPFLDTEVDRKTFFGRGHECRSLLSLILAERLVVLFSKSGLGKTSLINAGLKEPLSRDGYFPMTVRVGGRDRDPLQALFEGIEAASTQAVSVDCVRQPGMGYEKNLWSLFQATEFWSAEDVLLRPVLILDQFEELFTLNSPKSRREVFLQLAELVRGPKTLLGEYRPARAGASAVKIVISLREGFLADLEELAKHVPGVLHNRFRLGPLTKVGARNAIVEPARLDGASFDTAPFTYSKEAVDEIIAFLSQQRLGEVTVASTDVEPAELQLICLYYEEKARGRQTSARGRIEISREDVGGKQRMEEVLRSFYDRTFDVIKSPAKRRAIRRLCEKRLISRGGRRLTEEEEEIEKQFNVSRTLLRKLVNARLLRAEPRLGGIFYELSHDTLVGPIRQASARRRAKRHRILTTAAMTTVILGLGMLLLRAAREEAKWMNRRTNFQDCSACPEMVEIPGGSFLMGSSTNRGDRKDEDGPQQEVTVGRFALGRYEVTRREFAAFANEVGFEGGGCWYWDGNEWNQELSKNWQEPGFQQYENDPVVCVNWEDARRYTDWLTRKAGHEYRLPSEAEWEYAAREGASTIRVWSDSSTSVCGLANVGDLALREAYPAILWPVYECNDRFVHTAPVGSFQSSVFGLHDMLGNAWEWTEDCWDDRPTNNCTIRVIRGGSWYHGAERSSTAYRNGNNSWYRVSDRGFRVAKSLPSDGS